MKGSGRETLWSAIYILSLIVVSVGIAILIAIAGENRGWPRSYSIIVGAASGVLLVWAVGYVYQAGRCAIWRFTRGYPFSRGDTVEFTSGVDSGKRGVVVALGQVPWELQIQHEDTHEANWYSASQLRKVVLNT